MMRGRRLLLLGFVGRFRGLKRRRKVLLVELRGRSLEIVNGDGLVLVMESDGGTTGKGVRRVREPSGFGTMWRSLYASMEEEDDDDDGGSAMDGWCTCVLCCVVSEREGESG